MLHNSTSKRIELSLSFSRLVLSNFSRRKKMNKSPLLLAKLNLINATNIFIKRRLYDKSKIANLHKEGSGQCGGYEGMRTGIEPRSTASCAGCKLLKRKCSSTCIFAPYFRSNETKKFAKVHKVFGASNVSKILNEVPEQQREDTVNSLAFEAEARLRDPVYGCIGAIALLQRKMVELQHDLAMAKARLAYYTASSSSSSKFVDDGLSMMVYSSELSSCAEVSANVFQDSSGALSLHGNMNDFSCFPCNIYNMND